MKKPYSALWTGMIGLGLALPLFWGDLRSETPQSEVRKLSLSDYTSAKKCGECHQEIYNQWSQSLHSRSLTDPLYRTVIEEMIRETGGTQKVFCLSCHAPVAGVTGKLLDLPTPFDWDSFTELEAEGVTCDFCHTISGNENLGRNISVGAYVYPRRSSTDVKYGRHPDADNEHHAVEVSRFLTSSEFCAICHKFKHPVEGREIQNTYQEWLRGPYAKQDVRCQDCHMPAYAGRTAQGGKQRPEVHAHVFLGGHTEMIRRAATLSVWGTLQKEGSARQLSVTASIKNSGAGHAIPTGIPGIREMWLEVDVLDSNGNRLEQRRFRYGQRLVTENGTVALPWEAFEVLEDNRIEPERSRQSRFDVSLPEAISGRIRIEAHLYMGLISEAMGQRLNIQIPDPIPMASTEATILIE